MNATTTHSAQELADKLYMAFKTNVPLERDEYVGFVNTFEEAYQIQDAVLARKNAPVAGYKVSLTSQETQDMFKSDSPLYGGQLSNKFVQSDFELDLTQYNEPLVEVELMFTAKKDLTPQMSETELLENTTVAPTLELPDSRFKNWFPKLDKFLVLSDSAVGGAVVYGNQLDGAKLALDTLSQVSAVLLHNQQEVAHGNGKEVLGNPVTSLKWLVEKLFLQGKSFPKGTHASTGTFLLPLSLTPGTWEARFTEGFGTVKVNVK
ncbi:2-keto-4-pentenoate hydratase [Leuconostoc litchii]|uniref:2-keto-4-pentenoate hydratase n=1 Tax=Leuconostoc litchii TaxID=1981069 RepID=A0A6P2CJN2_9LACO|nr:2-keto-4-pentenoate hydratase [Leuconostoc litchii]TYC46045.1 2-keto-4-pentenoate hydratase [Leuconostoc litchii]GMA69879.1 2-keto-4-pentenoate hydratase [Leuconostoc litchii]